MAGHWERYDRWNESFVENVFWDASPSQPVYLDIDEGALLKVGRSAGVEGSVSEVEATFYADVRSTLNLDVAFRDDGAVFARHRDRAETWWRRHKMPHADASEAPPIIALLAAFSRAAEHMVQDDNFSSAAYLPRLMQLLDVKSRDAGRTERSFRAESEFFWGLLNQWLDDAGGAFGLPTAESIGHRYVGIPLSQALLRDSDRQALEKFFEQARLEPGLFLAPNDMADHLGDWFSAGHGSGSLKRLWALKNARQVLLDSVCQLLVAWDGPKLVAAGSLDNAPGGYSGSQVVLTARIKRSIVGDSRLMVGFAVRQVSASEVGVSHWTVKSAQGHEDLRVELEPLTDGLLGLATVDTLSDDSLLSGTLRLEECDTGSLVERKSAPICVLARSEEAGLFLEVQSARRDAEHIILVNGNARRPNGQPKFDLDPLLADIARPGFTKHEKMPGLLEGWILYRGVIIERTHSIDDAVLACLRPAASTAVVLDGGLRLPGRQDRWCEGSALRVRASSEAADSSTLRLFRLEGGIERLVEAWDFHGAEADVLLGPEVLGRGRLRVEFEARKGGRNVGTSRRSFMVVGSEEPRVNPLNSQAIVYGFGPDDLPGELAGHVFGGQKADSEGAIQGEIVLEHDLTSTMIDPPWWKAPAEESFSKPLTEPAPPDSCVFTGAHHEFITSPPGSRLDRGECGKCGRVRMYRKRAPARRVMPRTEATPAPAVTLLKARENRVDPSGELLLEALTWMQAGTFAEISLVIRQFEDSALSVHDSLSALESVGHIDLARDPSTLRVTHWQIAPRGLAQTARGAWSAIGGWGKAALERLRVDVTDLGGSVEASQEAWFNSTLIHGLDEAGITLIADEFQARMMPMAGRSLLGGLRRLVTACQLLPRVSAQGILDVDWFVPTDATWRSVKLMSEPGAFRSTSGFATTYFLRQPADLIDGTLARVSVAVAKHGASVSKPLLGYLHDTQQVIVPLGTELPALYARAMALMSGRPPLRVELDSPSGRLPCISYRDVPLADALLLKSLLSEGTT